MRFKEKQSKRKTKSFGKNHLKEFLNKQSGLQAKEKIEKKLRSKGFATPPTENESRPAARFRGKNEEYQTGGGNSVPRRKSFSESSAPRTTAPKTEFAQRVPLRSNVTTRESRQQNSTLRETPRRNITTRENSGSTTRRNPLMRESVPNPRLSGTTTRNTTVRQTAPRQLAERDEAGNNPPRNTTTRENFNDTEKRTLTRERYSEAPKRNTTTRAVFRELGTENKFQRPTIRNSSRLNSESRNEFSTTTTRQPAVKRNNIISRDDFNPRRRISGFREEREPSRFKPTNSRATIKRDFSAVKDESIPHQPPLPEVAPARLAAYEILERIEKEKAFSSALLPGYEENLKPEDRALCHELTLGVLRNQTFLDEIVRKQTAKPLADIDFPALLALRIGLYQIYFLDRIPPYAAVDESVNLVRLAKLEAASGFVNAILRQTLRDKAKKEVEKSFSQRRENFVEIFDNEVSEKEELGREKIERFMQKTSRGIKLQKKVRREDEVGDETAEISDTIDKIALETSHPHWLLKKWRENFGIEETAKIARANNRPPKVAFRLTDSADAETLENLQGLGADFAESEAVKGCFILQKNIAELHDFVTEGKIYLQDEASQLVGNTVQLQANEKFWDVCAAPGSKLTQIAAQQVKIQELELNEQESRVGSQESRVGNEELEVESQTDIHPSAFPLHPLLIGGDLYGHRVRLLREVANRFGAGDVQIMSYDAEKILPFEDDSFDCVLLDAPCSGTGTIRHNPEIRWHLTEKDLKELPPKQMKILKNVARTVKKGGRIIYSTCSLEPEENEEVINEFLERFRGFENVTAEFCPAYLTAEGFARTFPHKHLLDGFFIAVLRRKLY